MIKMMKVSLVFLAIVTFAMAQTMPEFMCSMNGTGSASLGTQPIPFTATVFRVKDTARYEVLLQGSPIAVIYMRPDVDNGKGKTYMYSQQYGGCMERDILAMSKYQYNETIGGYSYAVKDFTGSIFFDNGKPIREVFELTYTDASSGQTQTIVVTVNYDSSDVYRHETKDDFFSIQTCDEDGKTQATQAITSEQCGIAPYSSSSSSAFVVLPSALLLVVAFLLALF